MSATIQKGELGYSVVSDADQAAARAFGLAFQLENDTVTRYKGFGIDLEEASGHDHGILPVPAVFLIGQDGVVDFSYVNPDYRVRLHPEILIAAARVFAQE